MRMLLGMSFGSACTPSDGRVHGYRVGINAKGRLDVGRITRGVVTRVKFGNRLQ